MSALKADLSTECFIITISLFSCTDWSKGILEEKSYQEKILFIEIMYSYIKNIQLLASMKLS